MNKLKWFFISTAVVAVIGLSTTCCVPMPPPTVLPTFSSQPPALEKVITGDDNSWMPINVFGRPEENPEGVREVQGLVAAFKNANPQLEVTHWVISCRPDSNGNWTGWRSMPDDEKRANCAFTYGLWIFHKPKPPGAGNS